MYFFSGFSISRGKMCKIKDRYDKLCSKKDAYLIIIQDNGVHENQIAAQIQIAHLENLSPINP